MARWLLLQLTQTLGAAWLLASVLFLLSRLGPAAPELQALEQAGQLEQLYRGAGAGREQATRERLGLGQPLFYVTGRPGRWQWHGPRNQYHAWLRGLLHGHLGASYRDGQPVTQQLGPALAATLPLVALALLLAAGAALALALYLAGTTGLTPGRAFVTAALASLQAVPLFVLALLLLLLLANPDVLNLLPAADLGSPGSPAEVLAHAGRLVLPLLALALTALPELTLPLAATLRYELARPYAVAARAKGLSTRQVLRRHALPNAALPLLAALAEQLPALVAGTVVVEVLFALPGMGRLLAEAAAARDYPLLQAGLLLAIGVRLLALLAADLAQYRLDPRLRATLPA